MSKLSLIWDKWNKEHIKKHKVTIEEVEQAYHSKNIVQTSYRERKLILGKTKKGRVLTIILSFRINTSPYVVSARDQSKKERRLYEEKTKSN